MEQEKVVPKIAVFIWNQGNRFSRAIDLESLVAKASKPKHVVRCEVIEDPWGSGFFNSIKKELENREINRILWLGRFSANQTKRIKNESAAMGLNPYLHEFCDLEEQGIGYGDVDPRIWNRKAICLLQMALARTRLLEPLEPEKIPASDAILIIGAGVAGLHTAESLAGLGKRVYLIEKQSGVGGKVALLSRFYPRLCDPHCGLDYATQKLNQSEKVEIHTLARLVSLTGSPGNFEARIEKQPRYVNEERCNACGDCMNVCPKDIPALSESMRGAPPANRSMKGIGELLQKTQKAIHPATPMAQPAAFVIEREHCLPECRECEKVCAARAVELDQAPAELSFRVGAVLVTTGWEPYPLAKVEEYGYGRFERVVSNLEMERLLSGGNGEKSSSGFALSELKEVGFIQCAGSRDERHLKYCSSVCCSATLKQVLNLKEQVPDAKCYIFYQHMRSPGFEEDLYRRVRSMEDVVFVRERPATVVADAETGKLSTTVLDPLLDRKIQVDLDLLVLAGGMQPSMGSIEVAGALNLPQNENRFFESHHQCHPEESQRTGIYVGGCCREPMNAAQSIESSHRAAMKALSFLQGDILVEPTYPVLSKTKCDQCKRCMEDCPYASFYFDEKDFPTPDLTRCRQCGNCMGVCPLAAISVQNNTIKQMSAQVEAVDTSFMGDSEPVVLAFLCENDAYRAARAAMDMKLAVPPNVIIRKVPCAGSVNNALIADALSFGIDGVLIAGCKDNQCHYVRGSQLVQKRSGDLSEKLNSMMIERERVRFEYLEIREAERYVDILTAYIKELRAMGPNPFKI